MNKYLGFYNGRKVVVEASTMYDAQQQAAKELGVMKKSQVNVMLAERNGEVVYHVSA